MATTRRGLTPGVIVGAFVFVLLVPLLPILISGRWGWWQMWVLAALTLITFAVSRLAAARRNPDLITERAKFMSQADAKPWDKVLAPLVGLGANVIPIAAGTEARFTTRVGFGPLVMAAGFLMIVAGYALASWALVENRFFSGVVRIQAERGHAVVSSGPYGWVRHPGYAGGILAYIGTPLWLDSRWALWATLFFVGATMLRTALEDRTLQEELPGYREYAQRVRYRLVPGIW